MNKDLFGHFGILTADWSILLKLFILLIVVIMLLVALYDRFVQRENQLLINYPLIGRLRYFFYLLRNPMRQYFGDETFYDSFEKLSWINKVAAGKKTEAHLYLIILNYSISVLTGQVHWKTFLKKSLSLSQISPFKWAPDSMV